MKRFYKSIGRKDIAEQIPKPKAQSKLPEILTDEELKNLINEAGSQDGSLRNRLIIELFWESAKTFSSDEPKSYQFQK